MFDRLFPAREHLKPIKNNHWASPDIDTMYCVLICEALLDYIITHIRTCRIWTTNLFILPFFYIGIIKKHIFNKLLISLYIPRLTIDLTSILQKAPLSWSCSLRYRIPFHNVYQGYHKWQFRRHLSMFAV